MTRDRWLIVATAAVLVIAAGAWSFRSRWRSAPRAVTPVALAPLAHRVRVEVLNSGRVIGAARVGTVLLRRAGLDIVYYGGADSAVGGRERSQVLVRRGDTTGVGRIIGVLGKADVIDAPDPSRLVELTVLLGKDFAVSGGARP